MYHHAHASDPPAMTKASGNLDPQHTDPTPHGMTARLQCLGIGSCHMSTEPGWARWRGPGWLASLGVGKAPKSQP